MACCSMFSRVSYSEYSILENPYMVREPTDAVAKTRETAKNTKKQELKKRKQEVKLNVANAEAQRLTNHLRSENTQNTKTDHYKSELGKDIRHQSGLAAAAQKRVDHYAEKIKKQTGRSEP